VLVSRPEYVMDVPYVRTFLEDLSPARLRLVAALNGAPPPPAEDFDYCDLGSGHGDTIVTLAAAYPKARFVGVELNPEHVATARELARSGGLRNVRFVERDFRDLGGGRLPAFDYVASHGVLTWIGPETRAAMLAFAAASLKPGGLFYVGYNSLPGWAVVEPLRRLLADRAAAAEGSTAERAEVAVRFAHDLAAAGSRYFTRNEPVLDVLRAMEKAGTSYVVHEYLHEHWAPMYFADLARQMAPLGLDFVGQLPVYLNERDLAVPPAVAKLLGAVQGRLELESLMGYATNQFLRRDVWAKGPSTRGEASTRAYLDATPFASLAGSAIPRAAKLPYHSLHFVGEVFEALLPILEAGAAPLRELVARPELQPYGVQRVRSALVRLILGGQIAPLLGPTKAAVAVDGPYRLPSAYNQAVVRRPRASGAPFALASPVAGTGIVLSRPQALALRFLTEGRPEDRADRVRAFVEAEPGELALGEQDHELAGERGPADVVLLRHVERVRREQLGKLVELGVVEAASEGGY
jgi:SAM-dependent methyltransferase